MQNINPIFILQPAITIAFSAALMLYWYKKRHFHANIWLFALIAYGGAIGLKYLVQIPTIPFVSGADKAVLGAYYGVQTMVFEVGLAYLVAYLAVKHSNMDRRDAEAYGSGLAFWENAAFLSALSLVNLIAYYVILSGGGSLADLTYNQLATSAPTLFTSNSEALGLVSIGIVERISSAMIHIAWGYLCVMAVLAHRKKLFFVALPMGLIDFLVPYAAAAPMLFEVVVFAIAALSLIVAWYLTADLRRGQYTTPPPASQQPPNQTQS